MEELVFALPTEELWKLIPYAEKGFVNGDSEVLKKIMEKSLFRKRDDLEEDPSFKQLIPYAIISHKDSLYLFKRSSGQTEKRLHHKLSLGVGGHMNPRKSNESKVNYPENELKREFFEEVILINDCTIEDIEFVGFINDDTIPVGRVHIGLFYIIKVSSKDLTINEKHKMTAEWIDINAFNEVYNQIESWSQFAFDNFFSRD